MEGSPMKYRFVCEEHQDFGGNGWRLESQPGFDPLGGMAVAHDIIEHFPDGDESPADEFQALGASYFVRGCGGYFSIKGAYHSPESNIASDFPMILQHIIYQDMYLRTPPATRPLREESDEEGIQEILREARKLVRSEFSDPEDQRKCMEELKKAEGWLRIGFRRASKRYAGNLFKVVEMFLKIEKEADRILRHAEIGDVLEINVSGYRATIALVEPEYALI
jgi:hypothetical protein